MGVGGNVPDAPSYEPMLQAALQAFTSDQAAASTEYGVGAQQFGQQGRFADTSAMRGEDFMRMSQDARNWGRQQFDQVWPYALNYLNSQQGLSDLAGQNAEESVIAAREGRQRATDTYNRYLQEFVPIEQKYAQRTMEYADPLNAQRAAERARTTSRMTTDAALQRQQMESIGYGVDPSQAGYQGASTMARLAGAAQEAGAGTNAYEQQRLAALSALGQGAQFGTGLSSAALQQLQQASQSALQGLQGGALGGGGLTAANQAMQVGGALTGSPVAYGYMSNPYTALTSAMTSGGTGMYQAGNQMQSALGDVIKGATGAQSAQFSGEMDAYKARQQAEQAAWGGLFKGIGGIGSLAMAPMTGGGSLFGNAMSGWFPETFGVS